jgi:hopanoid biosynthesis associated RND transporter like protein HpnN
VNPPSPDIAPPGAPRDRFGAAVAALIGLVLKAPLVVVIVSIVATIALGVFTVKNVSINTDTTEMLSPDLPFRRDFDAYRRAYPVFANNIVVVVEADDSDRAEDGAEALYQRLQQDKIRFHHIFYPEGDRFFRQNGLLYIDLKELQALAQRLSEAQPLLSTLARDQSIRGLFDVLGLAVDALGSADAQPRQIARVLGRISAVIEARDADRPRSLSWKELMGGEAASGDRRRIIVLQPELNFSSVAPAADALKEIRRHARELGLTPENGVRVRLSGSAAIDSEEIGSIADNTRLSSELSILVVALLLVVCFRSFRLVLASLVTLVVGIVLTGAFAIAAIGSFNLISIAFAVLFIGIGIDYSIHVALRYREMVERGHQGSAALTAAGRSIGTALGLMAASSALGFFSFLPTDYRGVSELGLIAGFSMLVAFATNVTVLPAMLALMPYKAPPAVAGEKPRGQRLVQSEHWLWRQSRTIVFVAAAIGIVALFALWGARFDRNPLNLKDPTQESVSTAIDLLNNPRLRVSTVSILVDSVAEIAPLAEKLKKLPSVESVRSIYDYVPRDQEAKLDVLEEIALQMTPILSPSERAAPPDAEQRASAITALRDKVKAALEQQRAGMLEADLRRLLDALDAFVKRGTEDLRTAALEQDLLGSLPKRLDTLKSALAAKPVDFAALPETLRWRELSPAGKVRIEVVPKEDLRDNRALRRFVSEVQSVAPYATGGPIVELHAGDAVVHAFAVASIIAFVLICVGLLLLLRSITDLLLILAPLLLASLVTIGIAVVSGISFNFANVIVLPLLIGLGVSSGIHLVIRARRDTTIELLNTTTPRAVLFSAFTTIVAFASLAISSHWGQASMGILLLIAMSVNLVCYLVVLPALLAYVEQRRLARLVRKGHSRARARTG